MLLLQKTPKNQVLRLRLYRPQLLLVGNQHTKLKETAPSWVYKSKSSSSRCGFTVRVPGSGTPLCLTTQEKRRRRPDLLQASCV
ncbi:hypothetical protein ILYODFUR_029036, partial [Ilyodon furcidens]